ncbi:spindle apparatus coiled-coil protein 1 spindly [Musca autumnalis]|uniref:spindle apparatus coiled-coil protein 1 spindly n=1 Tax=Musca autumnalis TaxID=221902 RepID=UPI003CEF9D7D
MVDYPDILNFSRDELLEEFCKLFDRYQDLKESNEADTQKIHELKRSLDTATAAQAYLSQELEQYTSSENNQDDNELQKALSELAELRKRHSKLELSYNTLQQDHNALLEENAALTKTIEELTKRKESEPAVVECKTSEEDLQRIQMLECENMDLLQKMEDFQEQTVRYTLTIAECEKNIEILRDQINCLEENLQSKKADLDEKVQILESTQEQLAEANAQIAMLSAAPENNDRKGNSLFAEVDDQRQAMKQLLNSQKKSYMQMKKIYNESEHEIRRLKRENIAMHTELEACSAIFCNADKIYQEKLNERVRSLLSQNEELERKLKWNQERLNDLAKEKGVLWLDSMLSYCKKETEDLKRQLHSVRLQKANLEEQQRNSQQDLARWRFEALKSRCLLMDREHLLTENKIEFKPVHSFEFHIGEKEQNEARPRIVSSRRSATFENITRKSMTPQKVATIKDENDNSLVEPSIVKDNKQEENTQEIGTVKLEPQEKSNHVTEDKENITPVGSEKSVKLVSPTKSPLENKVLTTEISNTPPSRSILTKQRDLFSKEPSKIVKFSSKEDLVHSFTPQTPSPSELVTASAASVTPVTGATAAASSNAGNTKDKKSATFATTPAAKKNTSKAVVNQTRAKSNIVVRRVFVGSKHD